MTNEISICACCYICYLLHLNTLALPACLSSLCPWIPIHRNLKEEGWWFNPFCNSCLCWKDSDFEGLMQWNFMSARSSFIHSWVNLLNIYGESWYFYIVIAKVKYFRSQWLLFVKSRRCWKYEIKPSDTCFIQTRMKFDVSPLELVTIQETAAFDKFSRVDWLLLIMSLGLLLRILWNWW